MAFYIKQVVRRYYIDGGNTYPHRQALSDAKWNWDKAMRQWWTADSAKAAAMLATLNGGGVATATPAMPAAPAAEDVSRRPVYAQVEYKGRKYYQIGRSERTGKLWLTVLDGSINFWALADLCQVVKTYSPREYRGRKDYQTLGGLRRFIEQQRNPATARVQCPECGSWHDADEDCRDCGGC